MNKKSDEKLNKYLIILFSFLFIMYCFTYVARLNYSATIPALINNNILSKSQAGMISTIFFFTYGIGQVFNAIWGDKYSPKIIIFIATFISSISNIFMGITNNYYFMCFLWAINGLFLASIWCAMIKCLLKYFNENIMYKVCIYLNLTIPVGSIFSYVITSIIISKSNYRNSFIIPGIILMIISILWLLIYYLVNKNITSVNIQSKTLIKENNNNSNSKSILISSGIIFLIFCSFTQGALKNGISSWVPVYLDEMYNTSEAMSAFSTVVIPIFNVFGVYLSSVVNKKFNNEVKSSSIFFIMCTVFLLVLYVVSSNNMIISLIMFGLATTTMTAVNTMLLSLLPTNFEKFNMTGTVFGLLNTFAYIGTTISTYSIGIMSEKIGWNNTILSLVFLAIMSFIICICVIKRWKLYKIQNL